MFKNQFDALFSAKNAQNSEAATREKIANKFADKPIKQRYKLAVWASHAFGLIASSYSILATSFLAFYYVNASLSPLVSGAFVVALLVGLGVGFCLELVKNAFLDDFFLGVYKYKQFGKFALLGALVLSATNVASSYLGASLLPQTVGKKSELVADFTSYETRRKELDETIKLAQKQNTYRGKLTTNGQKIILGLQTELQTLSKERDAHAQKIEATNSETKSSDSQLSRNLGLLAILLETFLIAAKAFIWFVDYSQLILDESTEPTPNHTPSDTPTPNHTPSQNSIAITPNHTPSNTPTQPPHTSTPRKIGFIYGQPQPHSETSSETETETETSKVVSKYGLGVCPTCKSEFHKNSYNHKFCSDDCKIISWEAKTGKKLVRRN